MSKPCMVLAACCIAVLLSANVNAQAQRNAPRSFAPGVLNVIKPVIDGRDAHSMPMPMPGISADYINQADQTEWKVLDDPKTLRGQTRSVVFHRDVWQHEYSFLPLRQLDVKAANLNGQQRNRNVWYMIYKVRNVGVNVSHEAVEDPKFRHIDNEPRANVQTLDSATLSDRFFGNFKLIGWVQDVETGEYRELSYSDRVSPRITKLIQTEEDPNRPLLDKIQMAQTILHRYPESSTEGGTWGVAVWFNVDPRLDYVSVKVSGLTNAFRMEVNPDKSIDFKHKTLQLNFWRPGDGVDQAQDPIIFGIPLTDDPLNQIDIARRYHLPGPVIRGEILDQVTLRSTLIFETDANLDSIYFDSGVAAELDTNQIPASVVTAFTNAGFNLATDAKLVTTIPGIQWTVNDTVDGKARTFVIKLKPEFWEKNIHGGIRFINTLDSLWIYE